MLVLLGLPFLVVKGAEVSLRTCIMVLFIPEPLGLLHWSLVAPPKFEFLVGLPTVRKRGIFA
jgi:hypothetical protein